MKRSLLVFAVVAASLLTPNPLASQISGSGSIQGVVSDSSGAVVPGATIFATNAGTGVKTERQTTAAGLYNLSPLPPGEYTVTVSLSGFQTLTQQHVVVDALSVVGLNLTLEVGSAAQEVTVAAAPPQLNTTDASTGQTMRNEVYTSLPLQMGNAVWQTTVRQNPLYGNVAGFGEFPQALEP